LGRKVYCFELRKMLEVPSRVERIVSLTPSVTAILLDMGLGHRLVGISPWDRFLEIYGYTVPSRPVLGSYTHIDERGLREARPDIVLIAGGYQARLVDELERLGVPYYVVRVPRGLEVLDLPMEVGYAVNELHRGVELSRKCVETLCRARAEVQGLGVSMCFAMEIGELVLPGAASHIVAVATALGIETPNSGIEASYLWGEEARKTLPELAKGCRVFAVQLATKSPSIERAKNLLGPGIDRPIVPLPILYLSDYGPRFIERLAELAKKVKNLHEAQRA